MADDKDNENETPAAPDEADVKTPDAAEAEAPTTDAPDAEAAPTDAAEAQALAGDQAEAPHAGAPDVAASEPEHQLSPKERRRRSRSMHAGEARPARTAQERHDERQATRKDKAVRRRARRLQERAKATERRAAAPAPEPLAPVHAPVEGRRRMRQGIVISDKAAKTITVRIDVARRHRRYEKIVRSSSTLHAHDENNDAREGDTVRVIESRPLSRTKRWALVDVLERAR